MTASMRGSWVESSHPTGMVSHPGCTVTCVGTLSRVYRVVHAAAELTCVSSIAVATVSSMSAWVIASIALLPP